MQARRRTPESAGERRTARSRDRCHIKERGSRDTVSGGRGRTRRGCARRRRARRGAARRGVKRGGAGGASGRASQERRPLEALWTGPYQALLATPTAAKIQGFTPWIHMSRLKAAPPPEDKNPQPSSDSPDASWLRAFGQPPLSLQKTGDASPALKPR